MAACELYCTHDLFYFLIISIKEPDGLDFLADRSFIVDLGVGSGVAVVE
jgi:hypothetical protein